MSDISFTLLKITLGDGDIDIGPLGLVVKPNETAAAAGTTNGDAGDGVADNGITGDGSSSEGSNGDATDYDEDDDSCGCPAASVGMALLVAGVATALGFAAAKFLGRDEKSPSGIAGDE
jgi:hypothetical protein